MKINLSYLNFDDERLSFTFYLFPVKTQCPRLELK